MMCVEIRQLPKKGVQVKEGTDTRTSGHSAGCSVRRTGEQEAASKGLSDSWVQVLFSGGKGFVSFL